MANQTEQNISMSPAAFEKMMENLLRTIVSEIRKPPVDPVKEAQKAREKETKEKANKEMWERKLAKFLACKHEREDGTCVVGWATQSDGKARGYCPHCDTLIGPELADLFPERAEEIRALVADIRRRPTGRKESVRYISA
jgi:hypothetical protein